MWPDVSALAIKAQRHARVSSSISLNCTPIGILGNIVSFVGILLQTTLPRSDNDSATPDTGNCKLISELSSGNWPRSANSIAAPAELIFNNLANLLLLPKFI